MRYAYWKSFRISRPSFTTYYEVKYVIKGTNEFLSKLRKLKKVSDNAILVTADVVGLYPNIPRNEGLEVLKKQLDIFYEKSIPTEDLV